MKIGIFGSALNPPTVGHRDAIIQALKVVDKVIVVPSFNHAFGKNMAPYNDRVAMTYSFCNDLSEEGLSVEAGIFEHSINNEGVVYSYDLMDSLEPIYIGHELSLVIGEDNDEVFYKFYKHEEIKKRWGVIVTKDMVPVRSTLVRKSRLNNESISNMVTKSVLEDIENRKVFNYWK